MSRTSWPRSRGREAEAETDPIALAPPAPLAPWSGMSTPRRTYRYLDLVMVAFVTVLVCSNLIGPAKIAEIELPLWGP